MIYLKALRRGLPGSPISSKLINLPIHCLHDKYQDIKNNHEWVMWVTVHPEIKLAYGHQKCEKEHP